MSRYVPIVRISAGRGLIGRRGRTIVFLPSGHHILLDRLLEAEHAQVASVVADIVLSDVDGAPDFVLVTWPEGPDTGGMQVIARGTVQLTSTLPSLPTLTGTGSTTWVEHRVPRNPAQATLSLGTEVQPGTDLVAGVAPAGGFELRLTAQEMTITDFAQSATPTPPSPPEPPEPPPMRPRRSPPANMTAVPAPPSPAEPHLPLDDEATLTADLVEIPQSIAEPAAKSVDPTGALDRLSALRAATGQEQPASESTAIAAPPEPPGPAAAAALSPSVIPPVAPSAPPPVRPSNDSNSSDAGPPSPPMSKAGYRLVLPSGAHFDLDRTVVIGRQPAFADAGMTDGDVGVVLLPLSVPPSVSRTHAFIRVDSDGAAVVDCGSGGGTAIAGLVGELVSVEPWVPTPLATGDTIYLGGPTALVVEEMTS